MTPGHATLVLHTHLPYCRLAGRWPHGEEWLHEALLECYLPLLGALRRLSGESNGTLGVTINITPILAEQIRDPLVIEHFRTYLGDRLRRAEADVGRFRGAGLKAKTAEFHAARYAETQRLFDGELQADVLGGFAALEHSGHIEIATSAATHGYLPLLNDDDAIRFQVETGIASHKANFGREPRSFWLPECAYRPGIERILEEAEIQVFFVETHLVTGGRARGKALGGMTGPYPELRRTDPPAVELAYGHGTTFQAYSVANSRVAVLARNERTGLQVWSAANGYPGDPAYREFHKKDDDSGLHYWRVTGAGVDLGDKAEYDPDIARMVARGHADHFGGVLRSELEAYATSAGKPGVLMASYDTELFGHWWLEGIPWLEATIRGLAADPGVELTTAGDYVTQHPPQEAIQLPEGSWGAGGDHRTWLNAETAWTWPEIHARQGRARRLLGTDTAATRQLARELLLLQSSDWQFLITTGQAAVYARERFLSHCERFDRLADAIVAGGAAALELAAQYEEADNPFAMIDPTAYSRRPGVASGARR